MNTESIHVVRVNVGARRRSVNRRKVKGLAGSIAQVGLLNPITVRATGDEYTLVAGLHRLEAAKLLGWSQIPAVIVELDDVDRMLAEIDENLIRNELSDLERGEHLAERKRLYLLKHPETAARVAGGKARHRSATAGSAVAESFASDAASKTGASERTVREDVQIAESIPEDVRDALRETPVADSKTDLMGMARLTQEDQRAVVAETDLSDKGAVRRAVAARAPVPIDPNRKAIRDVIHRTALHCPTCTCTTAAV
jgi:ParB family chromosome partitioning protein